LWLFKIAADLYGEHVQKLVGIYDAYNRASYRNKAEIREQDRRKNLQSDCMATAFMKSVWPVTGRTEKDWTYLLTLVQGDRRGEERLIGKTGTIKAWMRRGSATGDPASCNTWTAASSKVA
jgi:predicted metalloprotease